MKTDINSIITFFDSLLNNQKRQYDWDNSGIQIYLGNKQISRVGFALDPSESVIEQAINKGCELLITHHPFFFSGFKSIDFKTLTGKKTIKAIQHGLNIISYHTSYDLADYGLNDFIADKLDAKVITNFIKEGEEAYFKFAIYVPKNYKDEFIEILGNNGGGKIGNYSHCTFSTKGEGTFKPLENSNPFIGKTNELERVTEIKIETIVSEKNLSKLISAALKAHPYEEPAYDILPLKLSKPYGLGRVCKFDNEFTIEEFLKTISNKLKIKYIRHNCTNLNYKFTKFAVVTGSGASLWKKCLNKGVNIYITGDLKHHEALDAMEEGVNIIDVGHFETERIFVEYLSNLIKREFNIETIILNEDAKIKTWRQ